MVTDDDKVTRGETALAVDGQGIYFSFDRKNGTSVLNDVNITVTRGAIYSLLGPSGCGKTTLLKCIIGQHKPQEGSLKIYGKAPRSKGSFIPGRGVGYMPQDLALYPAMTIEETLTYFGALYHMDKQEINKRISCLIELLALPSKKKQIKHLSGGQQRRVSLAVALIHKPPLLILDEPTVGVDPLLRKNIWGHLVKLAKTERSSVVITTHYIEEARQAHVVGFMRHGHLLAESNPGDLIKQYGVVKLEDVFRRLCQNDHKRVLDHGTRSGAFPCVESPTPSCSTRINTAVCLTKGASELHGNAMEANCSSEAAGDEAHEILNERNDGQGNTAASLSPSFLPQEADYVSSTFSWTRFSCLCNKNFLWFKRNPCVMLFQIFVPTITLVVFCLCVGGYPFDLPVAIVNMEEEPTGYSGTFLNSIDKRTIQQKLFGNLSVALQSVRSGRYWAAVHIGPEFSTCLLNRFLDGIEATNDTLQCSEIKVYLDMTNHLIARTIYPNLLRSFQTFATDFLKKSGENYLLASHSLKVEDPVYASSSSEFTEFLAPGVILTFFDSVLIFHKHLRKGILKGHVVSMTYNVKRDSEWVIKGATATEVLLSLFFTFLLTVLLQITILLLCTFLIFNVPCNGPIFWTVVCVLLTGVGGMSYGLFISTICDDENLSFIIITATFTVTFMLSGIMWPLEAMPHYLRSFSNCLPLTLICHTLRCILSRGWNITDHHIWDGCLVSIVWIFSFLVLSIILLKIKK